jgi:hypothetical protein
MRMRSILVVLLVVTIPSSASDPSPEAAVLARLLDTEREAVRRELRAVLAASADGAAVLDRIAPLVKTDRGRDLVAAILVDLRTAARKDPASAERLLGARLSAETLWRLGLGSGGGGEVVLFFDARTFARVERGIERLSTLEYLVCPAPPAGGPPGKSYECLAGLEAPEWEAFGACYRPGCAISLRWRAADGAVTGVALADALPWARAGALDGAGLKIGGNHDERGNRRLPPHETPIQVGIARPASAK